MLQSEVAHDIADNIQTKLAQRQVPAVASYRRLDPETYEDYLRGRYFVARRTAEAMNTAVDYFQRAVQRDPQYAQAYVGLALAYEMLGSYEVLPPDKSYPLALKFANKALELDDTLSEAYTARANSPSATTNSTGLPPTATFNVPSHSIRIPQRPITITANISPALETVNAPSQSLRLRGSLIPFRFHSSMLSGGCTGRRINMMKPSNNANKAWFWTRIFPWATGVLARSIWQSANM